MTDTVSVRIEGPTLFCDFRTRECSLSINQRVLISKGGGDYEPTFEYDPIAKHRIVEKHVDGTETVHIVKNINSRELADPAFMAGVLFDDWDLWLITQAHEAYEKAQAKEKARQS